ncbi:MAG: hypothetical protein HYZ31_08605 [Gammaproteobacteria bacterium]|jgi:hypothetical protein|nr:hypothetical protein [Gammaproteobacteria bacterium]
MNTNLVYSIIESPAHPHFTALYNRLGLNELKFSSQRKAMSELKKQPAKFIVAEFFYGFGNNYAGANVSNLDVLLSSLQRYSPATKVIVLAQKDQYPHVDKLAQLFSLHQVLALPISEQQMEKALSG